MQETDALTRGRNTVRCPAVTPATGRAVNGSRRRFLAATVAALAGAPIAARCRAAETPGANRRLIDCQSHLFCEALVALMEKRQTEPLVLVQDGVRIVKMGAWVRKIPPHYFDVNVKLAAMDAAGIERTALSINDPGPEWFGADGPAVAQLANDFVAGIVARHPQRFFGLCVLPLQDMRAALAELDRCAKPLGMKGILLNLPTADLEKIFTTNARKLFQL